MSSIFDFLPEITMEISRSIIAFSAEHTRSVTEERRHPRYWADLAVDTRWWIIGDSGTGDHWLAGPDGQVWFFDHNHGELSAPAFEPVGIDITEWLILAHALGRFEKLTTPTDDDIAGLDATLESISPGLAERYPLDLPFD